MVSSTSMRNRRGAVRLFSSCDILRCLRWESSWNAGRLGPWFVDYNGDQDNAKSLKGETVQYCMFWSGYDTPFRRSTQTRRRQ
jgi:hypothetical protein